MQNPNIREAKYFRNLKLNYSCRVRVSRPRCSLWVEICKDMKHFWSMKGTENGGPVNILITIVLFGLLNLFSCWWCYYYFLYFLIYVLKCVYFYFFLFYVFVFVTFKIIFYVYVFFFCWSLPSVSFLIVFC